MPRTKSISDQLRQIVRKSGLNGYQVHQRIGFDQGTFSRFMRGEVEITTRNLNRLTKLFGLRLEADRPDGKPVRDSKTRKG